MPCDRIASTHQCHRRELKDQPVPAAPSSASILSHTSPPSTSGPACRICPQQSSLHRNRFRETWQVHAGPGRSTWRHQLSTPGCRLPMKARLQLFQQCCFHSHSSPVCHRIQPLHTVAAARCNPALGQAELLLQYALKLKHKLLNRRHVKQNLIFDLSL